MSTDTPFYSVHTHSRFSVNDALPDVAAMVAAAARLGYPALGLTDHGTMAGAVQLYKAAKKYGIAPLPGVELYLTPDHGMREQRSHHLTMLAYTAAGYDNLVRATTLATHNFFYRPRLDLADLAELAEAGHTEGLAIGTGCRSGLVTRTLMTQGEKQARRLVAALAGWFPRTYVEVMNHGIIADGASDDEIVDGLVGIADSLGLPLIVTADSHYLYPAETELHDWLKTLVSFSEDPTEGRFSGEGYFFVDTDWLARYLEPATLARGLDGLADLLEVAKVAIPALDTFTLKVPDVTMGADPQSVLEARIAAVCEGRSIRRGRKTTPLLDAPGYLERVAAELEVIDATGMAAYLLLVAGICDFMTARGIWYQARGSASGSLVCQLLGITQDDPIAWGIRMDRFLSGDRTSPPDIDLDIDHSRRDEVTAELRRLYAVRQVCNYGTYKLNDEEEDGEQKGSLRVRYFATQRKLRNVSDGERVPEADWAKLVALSGRKLISQTGTHPAGFLVASSETELARLPLTRIAGSDKLVTSYDKDDVEPFGIPKIDLLGLRTLHGLRLACEIVAPDDPRAFYDAIPPDDAKTMRLVGSGDTVGMFQLEGWTQRKGCSELAPTRTADLVAAQALFRPGVSKEFLATYMRRRKGFEPVPAMHPHITTELADTYGVAIFQEQVVGVLRAIGMPPAELTGMLKAVKASGKAGLERAVAAVNEALPGIIGLANAAGWGDDDIEWLESSLVDYAAGYSFGKAHSVRYGVTAYATAWLRVHHPLAFWTGMLTAYTGHKDSRKRDVEKLYRNAARSDGLVILEPHANHSSVDYRVDGEAIRAGLVSLPYIGRAAAPKVVAHAPYASWRELGEKLAGVSVSGAKKLAVGEHPRECGDKSVIRWLWASGALSGIEPGEPPPPVPVADSDAQQALKV